jgi:hypothetical protein
MRNIIAVVVMLVAAIMLPTAIRLTDGSGGKPPKARTTCPPHCETLADDTGGKQPKGRTTFCPPFCGVQKYGGKLALVDWALSEGPSLPVMAQGPKLDRSRPQSVP